MKILIIDKVHPLLMDQLIHHNYQVDYLPEITYNETLDIIDSYNGIVVRSKFRIDEELMKKAPNLKFVARAGVGLDIFDVDYCNDNNIKVLNASGANANAVAEHALGMLLNLSSNITKGNNQVKNFEWKREENRAFEIDGKTIGIIGFGNTGKAFAKKLQGFDCDIIAYDKYNNTINSLNVTACELEEIFIKSDIVSIHTPLTQETLFRCDSSFFNSFKKPIVFINTARGKIVDSKSLLEGLNTKKVIGACLDVLEEESFDELSNDIKKNYKEIFLKDNVIVTPHVAGWSFQSFEKISKVLVKNILSVTD